MLSSSPELTLLVFVFLAGALLFALGTFLVRREAQASAIPSSSKDDALAVDIETRIDHIERLAMVGQPWCVEELRALRDDADERVRDAAENAQLVIGTRG